jgi:hypothetical protein
MAFLGSRCAQAGADQADEVIPPEREGTGEQPAELLGV